MDHHRHTHHLRVAVPPRHASHPFPFPSTPTPTPSKNHRLPLPATGASPYLSLLLCLLSLHSLFLLLPALHSLPSLPHLLPLPPLLAILSSLLLLLLLPFSTPHPHPLPHLLPSSLLLSLSLLLRFLSLRLLPSPGPLVLADSAGSLLARTIRRPSRRGVFSLAIATASLLAIFPSPSLLLPLATGFLSAAEHSAYASARQVSRNRRAQAATFALAAAFLSVPALVGLVFLGGIGDGSVPLTRLWWPLLNVAMFSIILEQQQEHYSVSGDFVVKFLCTVVLELVYYPKLSLPVFLVCGFWLWVASRELAPVADVDLGNMIGSESVYKAVMGPVRHILSERKSRKIAAFLLINTAYMVVEFAGGFMSNSLGLISDACHMLFDCAALAIGLYASYIARLPANGLYNYGRGRFEVLSGYVNAVFLVLVGALIVLESFERILDPREISTSSLLVVSIGGLVVNIIGLVFFHEEHHHAHGGSCSHSHSHSLSNLHSHARHHSHEDCHHHVHVHQGASHDGKGCSGHHGDASKSHHHHCSSSVKSHHHHDHGHEHQQHNHGSNHGHEHQHHDHRSSHSQEDQHHSHGHEHRHHDHGSNHDHFDHQQGGVCAHQECSMIDSEQGLLEIPLGNVQTHYSEVHTCDEIPDSSENRNHKSRSGNRHLIDHNMEGIFLHVLADTMGSVGVVISTLLIKYKGWLIADPICSVFISIMIVSSVLPLLRNSAEILLQRVPRSHEKDLRIALDDVMKIKGVCGVDNIHVWNLTNTDVVGTFHLRVWTEADRSFVREKALQIFCEAGIQDLTIQIECIKR